jgi:murein DD-endopeptidase MepM/ murein hydrolase activator NlpD
MLNKKTIIKSLLAIILAIFLVFGGSETARAGGIEEILNKPVKSLPDVACNSDMIAKYTAMKVKTTCNGGTLSAPNYLTVGMLNQMSGSSPLKGTFGDLIKKTGVNPSIGSANTFLNKFVPGNIPYSAKTLATPVNDIPLVSNLAKGLNIPNGTTLKDALANPAFAKTPLSVSDTDQTSLQNAIPGGELLNTNISAIKGVAKSTIADLNAFAAGGLSLKDLGASISPGAGFIKLDVALGTPKAGSTENNILKKVVTGGSNGSAQSVSCGGKSCPHFEGKDGKRVMESSFQVEDGFGYLCSVISCKGPSGLNALGLNPQLSINGIDQKSDKAKLAISFRFCSNFPSFSCSPAIFPTPGGIPIGEIKTGDSVPFLASVSKVGQSNSQGGDFPSGGSGTAYTNPNTRVATNLPVPANRKKLTEGNAVQIRVKNNGGYALLGVERVPCNRDGQAGYCLKINDLAKAKAYLASIGVEFAYDFKQGDLIKELSNNYVIKDSAKFTKNLVDNNLINPQTGQVEGVNLKGVTCMPGTTCDTKAGLNIATGPSSASGNWLHPMNGVGNSRLTNISNGYFGAPRPGRPHVGQDLQSSANGLTFTRSGTGAKIYAANNGTVTTASFPGSPSISSRINISHGGGVVTSYVHVTNIAVQSGQQLQKGSLIAEEGAMGVHTGAHLHFEVAVNGAKVNPLNYNWTPSINGQRGQSLAKLPIEEKNDSVQVDWGIGFLSLSKTFNLGDS